jgi:hypothetical protein
MKDNVEVATDYTDWMVKTGGYAKDMTLRDYFAARAMQYWLSLPIDAEQLAKVSTEAYKVADAMLKENAK